MDITPELLLNGALAFLIIKEVLQFVVIFLKKRSTSNDTKFIITAINNMNDINSVKMRDLSNDIKRVLEQSNSMYDWHDTKDDDGVFIWYVRKSLAKSLDGVASSLLNQNDTLRQIVSDNKELMKEYSTIYNMVRDNQKSIEENKNLINQYRSIKEDVRDDLEKMPEHMKHCRDVLVEIVKNEIRNEIRNNK